MRDWMPYLPGLIGIARMALRARGARIVRRGRLWISPAVLRMFVALYAFAAVRQSVHLDATADMIILAGGLVGAGLGAMRARLMQLDLHPETGQVQARMTA